MFEQQIARGVEFLDQDLGPSWVERIDLDQLEMQKSFKCVIGQLYGDFWKKFRLESGDPLGFSTPEDYEILTQEWREKIAQLRAERTN